MWVRICELTRLTGRREEAVDFCRRFLETFPADPRAGSLLYTFGRTQSGEWRGGVGVRIPAKFKYLSIVTGSAQRLPNGNTVSLHTDTGRVFEITPQGEIVWESINPRGRFYRTQRIAYEDCPQADPFFAETDGHAGAAR